MINSLVTALTFALAAACATSAVASGASDSPARGTVNASAAAPRHPQGPHLSVRKDVPKPPVLILGLVGLAMAGMIVMQRKGAGVAARA